VDAGIRPFEERDARSSVSLLRVLWPHEIVTVDALLHELRNTPARAHERAFVAVRGDEVVGYGEGGLRWRADDPTVGDLWVGVREDARGRGLGAELHTRVLEHLAAHCARTIRSGFEDESGARFAARHGYRETRRERYWTLDPRRADLGELPELERALAAEGFRLAPLREHLERPRDLHALYAAAEDDIPADDVLGELDYDEWERETLEKPLLDADASMNVLHGDRPVSFAWLLVDREGGRAEHELTGTLRDYRGRGLARLAKLASLCWCADNGIHTVLTANDTENAPMLRINERLGYLPTIESVEIELRLA
jgi:GNAT superfamily N-acetyltransferase